MTDEEYYDSQAYQATFVVDHGAGALIRPGHPLYGGSMTASDYTVTNLRMAFLLAVAEFESAA